MRVSYFNEEARWLMTAGAIAAAKMHARGMPVDVPYCEKAIEDLKQQYTEIEAIGFRQDGGREWKQRYGHEASFNNDNQLRFIIQEVLQLETDAEALTAGGLISTKAAVLEELCEGSDIPLLQSVLTYRKYYKAANTFLSGILQETVDGVLHPFFHVCGFEDGGNTVVTYRTSSSRPNFQNQPTRDPVIGKLIRNAIRAPKGYVIMEADYSAIEVHAAAWYHKDPTMLKYLRDDLDMHKDMTLECFMLSLEEYEGLSPKPKALRNIAKNAFTFPEFYGSYWPDVATGLWKKMASSGVTLANGVSVVEHLKAHGVQGLLKPKRNQRGFDNPEKGSYCKFIQQVEQNFWKKRFPVYNQWKLDWLEAYRKEGGFTTLTGFRHEGIFRRNEVINTPVQGTACHCKLRALIHLFGQCEKRKIRGMPNAEIHDSILSLVPKDEADDYASLTHASMVTHVKEAWPFIITPIKIEIEQTPEGGTWYEKEERKFSI